MPEKAGANPNAPVSNTEWHKWHLSVDLGYDSANLKTKEEGSVALKPTGLSGYVSFGRSLVSFGMGSSLDLGVSLGMRSVSETVSTEIFKASLSYNSFAFGVPLNLTFGVTEAFVLKGGLLGRYHLGSQTIKAETLVGTSEASVDLTSFEYGALGQAGYRFNRGRSTALLGSTYTLGKMTIDYPAQEESPAREITSNSAILSIVATYAHGF
jgi:hypothetical protein